MVVSIQRGVPNTGGQFYPLPLHRARIVPQPPKLANFEALESVSAGGFFYNFPRPGAYFGPIWVIQAKKLMECQNVTARYPQFGLKADFLQAEKKLMEINV